MHNSMKYNFQNLSESLHQQLKEKYNAMVHLFFYLNFDIKPNFTNAYIRQPFPKFFF